MLRDPNCTACPLYQTAKTVCVPGDGSITSRVVLIGEAPGDYEDQQGQPFVGRSGRFLRAVLKEFGIEARIENTVRCRPPANRDPKKEEIKACLTYLHQTLKVMSAAEILVPLGKVACRALGLKGAFLRDLAGRPRDHEVDGKTYTVLAIAHPAYVQRNPAYVDVWEGHWKLLRTLLNGQDDPSELIGWTDDYEEIIG